MSELFGEKKMLEGKKLDYKNLNKLGRLDCTVIGGWINETLRN